MLYRLLVKARYLTIVPVLGLLLACLALYTRGSRLILQQLYAALLGTPKHLNLFEIEILEGVDLLLVGTGCLALAIGMFSLFVREVELLTNLKFRNFHEVKGTFANFIILAMAITFVKQLNGMGEPDTGNSLSGPEIFFAGAGIAVVTLALLAFKHWGGEKASHPK